VTLKEAIQLSLLVKRPSWSGGFVMGRDGCEYRFDEKLNDYVKSEESMEIRLADAIAEDWIPLKRGS